MDRSSLIEFTDRINLAPANESHVYSELASSDSHLQQHAAHRPMQAHQQPVGQQLQIPEGSNYVTTSQFHKAGSESDDCTPSKPKYGKKTRGRVKVRMQFINDKLRRYTTFSKRKTGIMKKAYELSTLTGTQVMLLVASETGHVYTFATKKLQPMITSESGKALIQTCLNSPEAGVVTQSELDKDRRMNPTGFEETELCCAVINEDDDGTDSGEMHDLLLNGELSDNQTEHTHSLPSTGPPPTSSTTSTNTGVSGSTFNIHTIIPPTSNSDGTLGKATNLSMQVPQPTSISQVNMSLSQPQQHIMFSSDGSDTDQVTSRSRAPLLDFPSQSDLQRQQEEQQQEIQRLTQLKQQQQLQCHLQQLQIPQAQVVQQFTSQPVVSNSSQLVMPKPAILAVGGNGQPNNTLLYQTPHNQTLVYTTTPTMPNHLTDGVALVNIVTSQPHNYSTSQLGTISSSGQPQYISIPLNQLTNNHMLQQVMSSQDLGNKT